MNSHHDEQPEEGGLGFGLKDVLAALRRRAWLIVSFAVAATAIACAVAVILPNQYEAVATIQIDPRKKTIVSLDAVLPDIAGDTPTIESQVEILHSRAIALRVIDALGLRNDPEFTHPSLKDQILRNLGLAKEPPVVIADPEEARRRMKAAQDARSAFGPDADAVGKSIPERDFIAMAFNSRLKTFRVRNTLIVEIHYRSRDPVKAARIASAIAEAYIRDQIDTKIRATGMAAELIEKKLVGLRAKVSDAETRIAQFKSKHGIFDAEGQLLSEKKLARVMEQTVVARNVTAEARARFNQLQEMLAGGEGKNVGDVLQSHTVRMLKDLLAKATRKEAELLTKYGPRHPDMVKARAEVADVERQIKTEIDQIIANLRNEFKVAVERERTLIANLADLKKQQSASKEVAIQLHDLQRELEASRRLFETFLSRYKQTAETQFLHLPDARIVEDASVPGGPVTPKRKQIVVFGFIGGLGLGLGLAIVMALLTTGVSRPEDTDTAIGVPHLTSLPLLKRESDGLSDPLKSLRVLLVNPAGAFATNIRALMTKIDARRVDTSPRIMLVASSLPGEGRTVIAANLALAAMAAGARTLLIDGDLRHSKLTQQLKLDKVPGLLDAIAHGQDFERAILKDTITGLAILPAGNAGQIGLAATDALEAPGFAQRLARLKNHFDVIVIDAPPILPVADARMLATHADQIVFVAAWKRTPKSLMRRAAGLLQTDATKIIGMVINQMDPVAFAKTPAGMRLARGRPKAAPRKAA